MATHIIGRRARGLFRQSVELAHRFANVNWALADQAVVSGTNFATTVLIARFLGVEEFGRFALAWLAVFFVQNLQLTLVVQPMMTIGAKQAPDERAVYTGAVLVQQVALAVVTTLLVFVGMEATGLAVPAWRLAELAIPVSLLVLSGQAAEFLRRYYFTFSRPRLSFVVDTIRYASQLAGLGALFLFAREYATIASAVYVMAGAGVLGTLAGAAGFRAAAFSREMTIRITVRHWRFARWLAPAVVSVWARENLLYATVGAGLGLAEVGILRAAQQLVTMVNVPLHGFANVVPMRAGTAFSHSGYAGLVDFVDTFVLRYQAAILALLVAIALAGDQLLGLFYGAEYAGNGAVVAAFALVMMIYLVKNVIAIMVQAMEATAYEFYASAVSIVTMSVVIFPLVRSSGLAGGLMAYALYECAALLAISYGLGRSART